MSTFPRLRPVSQAFHKLLEAGCRPGHYNCTVHAGAVVGPEDKSLRLEISYAVALAADTTVYNNGRTPDVVFLEALMFGRRVEKESLNLYRFALEVDPANRLSSYTVEDVYYFALPDTLPNDEAERQILEKIKSKLGHIDPIFKNILLTSSNLFLRHLGGNL